MSRAVVFDVGKVLVNFSFSIFKDFLSNYGASFSDDQDFFRKTSLLDFEKGFISDKEFLSKIFSNLDPKLSKNLELEEIKLNWQNIFTLNTEMFEFAKNTANSRPVYLLSNTNPIHWPYLEKEYGLTDFVNGFLTSHQAGAMKPDQKIYSSFIDKFTLKPKDLIFVDDLEENIIACRELGWNGIHHVNSKDSIKAVNDFLALT